MKKVLLLVLVAFTAFYAHARISFAEQRLTSWLVQHAARAMSGDSSACDDYADDVEVTLSADGRRGKWEVEGGKAEICGYLRQAAAVFTVMQASTHADFEQVQIVRDGFPWKSARLKYIQRTTIQASGVPALTMHSEDTLLLVRTLSGIKIQAVASTSTGGV